MLLLKFPLKLIARDRPLPQDQETEKIYQGAKYKEIPTQKYFY